MAAHPTPNASRRVPSHTEPDTYVPPPPGAVGTTLCIDCDLCVLADTEACADCVVTFLCGVDPSTPVVVDLNQARAMQLLDEAGLAPPLRHRRRATMGM
ncbi:hypothetical protein BH23ACT2_BH23ACT2_08670 [soil metagenome]